MSTDEGQEMKKQTSEEERRKGKWSKEVADKSNRMSPDILHAAL